jgi:HSP20 family molecular chaperone IbpA
MSCCWGSFGDYRRERSISEASRLIKLPYSINKKAAKASYQNGVSNTPF